MSGQRTHPRDGIGTEAKRSGIGLAFENLSNLCEPDSLVRMIAESSTDAIFVKDLRGRYLMVNSVVERVCGLSAEQIVGATDEDLFQSDDARSIHEADLRAIRTGQTQELWETLQTPTGTKYFHTFKQPYRDHTGTIIGLVGVAKDVTATKATSRELEMSEQRLRLALESANQGLWDWKPATNEVYRGDNWYAMLGFKPEDIGGHDRAFDTLAHPTDRHAVHETIDRAMRAGKDGYDAEYRLLTRCGRWKWVRETGRVIEWDDNGAPARLVGVIIDIDAHKQAERTMARARDLAESANEAKSAFLASITHEIRTPLTAIIGYAEILAGDTRSEMSCRSRCESAEVIRRNGEFLLEMVNDLLDVSKIEAGKMSLCHRCTSPIAPVEEVIQLMRGRAHDKGLAFHLEIGDGIPETIETDPNRLRQILTNIVGNAIKFTPKGAVVVRVDRADEDPSKIAYTVTDTGIGLTDEQIDRLFKPFSQAEAGTAAEFGGTGLGLVISKQLAQQLGGDVTITSTFGSGSTFTISIATGLPDGPDVSDEPHQAEGSASPSSGLPLPCRILLAEDSDDSRGLLVHLLGRAGAEVVSVADGRAAVDAVIQAEADGAPFDLVILDLHMPELDGPGAAGELRRMGCGLPLLALTAATGAAEQRTCFEAGFDGFAGKPITRDRLLSECRRWIRTERSNRAA